MMYCCRLMSQLADVNIQSSVGMFTFYDVLRCFVIITFLQKCPTNFYSRYALYFLLIFRYLRIEIVHCFISIIMSPLRRHIFVCFMAKSAFWAGFLALAPYIGVGPIQCLDEICSVPPPVHTLKIWGAGVYSPRN